RRAPDRDCGPHRDGADGLWYAPWLQSRKPSWVLGATGGGLRRGASRGGGGGGRGGGGGGRGGGGGGGRARMAAPAPGGQDTGSRSSSAAPRIVKISPRRAKSTGLRTSTNRARTEATWCGAASASREKPASVSTQSTPRRSQELVRRATSPACSI